jgi:DegV family protein with EDD domain
VTFEDRTFKDRVELRPDQFYARLRQATRLPTTSQPTPGDFVQTFRSVLNEADAAVVVLVSGVLSGTFNAGQTAARVANLGSLYFVDSRSASLGQGMLVLRAAELAESGWPAPEIAMELERLKQQAGMFLTVDTYENLLRSGRVSRGRAWLAGMLDVKPIISLDPDGRLVPVDRARGREAVLRRVLQLLDQRLTPRPRVVRFGVAHADAPEIAERVRSALVAAFQPRDCFVSQASGVLGTHAGIGAWAVFYLVEDGTPTRLPDGVHG